MVVVFVLDSIGRMDRRSAINALEYLLRAAPGETKVKSVLAGLTLQSPMFFDWAIRDRIDEYFLRTVAFDEAAAFAYWNLP